MLQLRGQLFLLEAIQRRRLKLTAELFDVSSVPRQESPPRFDAVAVRILLEHFGCIAFGVDRDREYDNLFAQAAIARKFVLNLHEILHALPAEFSGTAGIHEVKDRDLVPRKFA